MGCEESAAVRASLSCARAGHAGEQERKQRTRSNLPLCRSSIDGHNVVTVAVRSLLGRTTLTLSRTNRIVNAIARGAVDLDCVIHVPELSIAVGLGHDHGDL